VSPPPFSFDPRLIAYKVKVVRCFFSVWAGIILPLGLLRADPADDLYNQGAAALDQNDYAAAEKAFDQIITDYPNSPNIHQVRLDAGIAAMHLGEYTKAFQSLDKEIIPSAPFRGAALFYKGLTQLTEAGSFPEGAQRQIEFGRAAATLTQLIDDATSSPTPDNQTYLEDAYDNRALAYFYGEKLADAEADVQRLLEPPFSGSLRRPDYLLLLGNLYAREAGEALDHKQAPDAVRALAEKAIGAFDQVSRDPNALVQANEADMAKAEVLYLIASLDLPDLAGYQKAIEAFHAVRRKDDLVPLQEARLTALKAQSQAQLQASQGKIDSGTSRLIERETTRLADLKNGPDPIIQALIRLAECYNAMAQGNEARTILHRLSRAPLTKDQQQEVDFALIYSYVLGGQTGNADRALTDYLARHPGDPQAQSLSVQMARNLVERKDYKGALLQAERSLKDFPQGQYAADAIELKAAALHGLGRDSDATAVADNFLRQNPTSPVAIGLMLTRAQDETAQGNLAAALADYATVKNNNSAGALQAGGAAGYIQTLQSLGKTDDVIRESRAFVAKFPTSPAVPGVLVMSAVAMDKKHDPGAVAALQDVARKYPSDDENSAAPFALYYVVNIYQRAGNIPAMIQAAADLKKAFPDRYPLLLQAADAVSAAYVKEKNFDAAIAEYQSLADSAPAEVAATARTKIGDLWLKAAKSMGAYQSMQQESNRTEALRRLGRAEQAFLGVLKNNPDQLDAVDDAFAGLDRVLLQRRSWGLLQDADFESYFAKLTGDLAAGEMATRLELAKAGLVFIEKDGRKQYPAALARFRAALAANPGLRLTRLEADHEGELLLAAGDADGARQVYTTLLASGTDPATQADGDYGLGAAYLAQGNVARAGDYFAAMKALSGGAAWHPHILDADYGLALAAERSGSPADLAQAKQSYAMLMQAPQASLELQARAMLGYGRILDKEGHGTKPAAPGSIEYAVHYYQQIDTIFGPALPELSAEGLYDAGQVYESAGDKADALKQYQAIEKNYQTTAPDWAAKAQAAGAKN
jgi:outer membrane protein assembly factor BamD (BamD/ComL family)